jgi:sigma-54 dependent transcriptional regulator, acetoin dehydrogenase operon transcriptional activator AcoR
MLNNRLKDNVILEGIMLNQIPVFTQQISEAISVLLQVEVIIIDKRGYRVSGTGCFKEKIGEKVPDGFGLLKAFETGDIVFLVNTGSKNRCRECIQKSVCNGTALIASPIYVQSSIEGVLAFIGFSDWQKKLLLLKEKELRIFIHHLGNLFGSKINHSLMIESLILANSQLSAILQSVPEGIIAVNKEGLITNMNRKASILTGLNEEDLINKPFTSHFEGITLDNVLLASKGWTNRSINLVINKKKKVHCFVTVAPCLHDKVITGAIVIMRDKEEVHKLVQEIALDNLINFDHIIGNSLIMQEIKQKSKKVARGLSTIILTGESGTGKEIFARAIHSESPFERGPFVAVNCAAIPENLLESELFGYEEGAFSGAKKGGKPGKFELAKNGTIFLDEIGDMPLSLQAKLLRVLEEKKIEKLGSTQPINVNSRIICATNNNLRELIKKNRFREDLYYRLSVISLSIPSLRERKDDLPLLMDYYLKRFNDLLNCSFNGFSYEVQKIFNEYPWPGNVRELKNIIEYAVNMETSDNINLSSLPEDFISRYHSDNINQLTADVSTNKIEDLEKELIKRVTKRFGLTSVGKKLAAEELGIGIATLYRKLNKYGNK